MRSTFVVILLGASTPALATTAARASLPELVAGADLVVLGTAGTPASEWDGGRIVTRVPVTVEEVWAGDAPATVVEVVTLGGVVGEIGQTVSGAPRLRRGERVVLCLRQREGRLRVVEMTQGAFFVVGPPAPDPAIRRRSFGLRLLGPEVAPVPERLRALERAVKEADHARRR